MENLNLLNGITIVDLTHVLSGPFATMVLANLGARVIKIEPPLGDDARLFSPLYRDTSLYFSSVNSGKESMVLNLKDKTDRMVFENLLATADLITENYRPGTMEKLEYGWDVLHERYPRLIYGAISGFGHSGPFMKNPAYDMVVQGMGGIMSVTGQPNSPPTRVGVSVGDIVAGLYLAIGLSAALYKRSQTGIGHKIDIGMLDCQVSILEGALTNYLTTGAIAKPLGARHSSIAPFEVYQTQDKPIIITVGNEHLFDLFCTALNKQEWINDIRYKDNTNRVKYVEELKMDIEQVLKTDSRDNWLARLNQFGIPSSPINDVSEVAENPQVLARNMLIETHHPIAGKIKITGNPIKVSGVEDPLTKMPAPLLGEHQAKILAELENQKNNLFLKTP